MTIKEIRAIAEERGIKPGKLSKAKLIKAIQRAEGNSPCFGTDVDGRCDQFGCLWREDCIPGEKRQVS